MEPKFSQRLDRKSLWRLIREAWADWKDDNAQQFAAAVAFFTILSLAPLLILAIALAGIFYGREAARGGIVAELSQYVGNEAARAIQSLVANAGSGDGSVFASVLGFAALAWGASRIFQQLRIALNQILDIEEKQRAGFVAAIRDRLVAIAGVVMIGLILLSAVVINAALSRLKDIIAFDIPGGPYLWQTISFVLSLALVLLTFTLIFRYLPDERIPWRTAGVGAAFTTVLFILGQVLITLYLSISDIGSSFGAGGSLIVLILWIYYSSSIFFFGAELMKVIQKGGPGASRTLPVPETPSPPSALPDRAPARLSSSGRTATFAIAGASGCLGFIVGGVAAVTGGALMAIRSILRRFRR